MLHGKGDIDYLVLTSAAEHNKTFGTFRWTTDQKIARKVLKAITHLPEGINVVDGTLYFVCKKIRMLFTLDWMQAPKSLCLQNLVC
jgi:hypothetical protein